MTEATVGLNRRILRLAIPNIISNLTVPLLGLVDLGLSGHLDDSAAIGGISIGTMLFNVLYWIFSFLRMGTSGLTAQAWGSRSPERMGRTLAQSFLIGLGGGLLFILLQSPVSRLFFTFLAPEPEVERHAATYFSIVIAGAPAVLTTNAMSGWFIGVQNSWYPMIVSIVTNITNIALSTGLVVGAGYGIEGVAIGTLASQWLGMLLLAGGIIRLYLRKKRVKLPRRVTQLTEGLGGYFSTNFRIFLRTFLLAAVSVSFTFVGTRLGTLTLAANSLLYQFFSIFSYFTDGFANAGEAMVGDAYGRGDRPTLRRIVRRLLLWGFCIAVLATLVYGGGGPMLLRILTDDEAVVQAAMRYLPWAVAIPLAGFVGFVMDGVFVGLMATRQMIRCMLGAVVLFFVLLVVAPLPDANACLWLAFLSYLFARGVLQLMASRRIEGMGRPFNHRYVILVGTTFAGEQAEAVMQLVREAVPDGRLTPAITTEDEGGSGRLYRNALLLLERPMEPEELTRELKAIEALAGRTHEPGGEVALDLDPVLRDGEVIRPEEYERPYFRALYRTLHRP